MKLMNIGRKYLYQDQEPGTSGNWRDALPDEIKADASLANFQDIGQMAKSFIDMKSYQGNSIHIPGDDAGDEQRATFITKLLDKAPGVMMRPDFNNSEQSKEFYRTLGMPEKADGYEFTAPEGKKIDEDKVNQFRTMAHDIGLTKSQFNKFITAITESDIGEVEAAETAQKESMDALNKEWGMATPERISQALSIAERTKAPDHVIASIKEGKMDVEMVKWIHSLSVSIGGGEGNNLGNLPPTNNGAMTPAEAKEKVDEIYKNRDHPFHKGDKEAMKRMIELVGFANPEASKDVDSLRAGASFG